MEEPEPYLVEFITVGRSVKVTAIDPVTGVEASIVGDAVAGRTMLENLAVRKLRYVLSHSQLPE